MEQMEDITIIVKALQLKLVRIMDILKENIPSLIVIVDKILLKTIKVTISNCLMYMPKVIKLLFKPLLLPLMEPY